MKKNIVIAFLALLLILALAGGGLALREQRQAAERLAIKVENQYQRNFLELASGVDQLNAQLAQLLVTTSHEQTLLSLSNLWRAAYGAIGSLGALPVAMDELADTDALLRDVAEYSYYLMSKNVMRQEVLAGGDWQRLEEFYRRSKVVRQELSDVEARILNENLRFSELERYLAQNGEDGENVILSAFRSIESQVNAFPELKFEEGVRRMAPEPRPISGELVTREAAVQQAEAFYSRLRPEDSRQGQVEFASEGGKLPVYGVRLYGEDKAQEPVYIEVSQRGGFVLQMYQYRQLGEDKYDLEQAEEGALAFLGSLDFPPMVQVDAVLNGPIADLTFVPVQDGVYIYSDMVKIQMALDDNSVLTYDQSSFATRHYAREIPAPALSKEDVRQGMNPHFTITDMHLALITDEYSVREILTYEVRGTVVEETFAIFVDATTGQELRVVRLTEPQQYPVTISAE